MKKLTCLVVDDEPLARDLLSAHIQKVPFLELAGTCKNALEARMALQTLQPDLLFLDIQMPDLTGLELLKSLPKIPATVLTTAYKEHALTAFELGVMDYLMKPIEFDRFFKSVSKVMEWVQRENPEIPLYQPETPAHIFIKCDSRLVKVSLSELLFAEALEKYVRLHLPAERLVSLMSMTQLLEILPATQFMRVHRSYIVNLSKVESFEGNSLVLGQHRIPLGKGQREAVMQRLV